MLCQTLYVYIISQKVFMKKKEKHISANSDVYEVKSFWEKYQEIKDNNEEKQILFLKNDLIILNSSKNDYSEIVKCYKERLVHLDAMRQLKNKAKTLNETHFQKKRKIMNENC